MRLNKHILCILFIFLLIISNSQAKNDSKNISVSEHQIYNINEYNSVEVTIYEIYSNKYNEDLPSYLISELTFYIYSFSKEPTFNHSVYSAQVQLKHVEQYPQSFGEYNVKEEITEPYPGQFKHSITFNISDGVGKFPARSYRSTKICFNINNFSTNEKNDNYVFMLSGIPMISPESAEILQSNDYKVTVNLPNSPYLWVDYIGSTLEPSRIIPKITSQSLVWDNYSTDISLIIEFKLIENPTSKKIDTLIEETNIITKQAEKSGKLALKLGIWSFILAFFASLLAIIDFWDIDIKKIIIDQYLKMKSISSKIKKLLK